MSVIASFPTERKATLSLTGSLAAGVGFAILALMLAHRGASTPIVITLALAVWALAWFANVIWSRAEGLPPVLTRLAPAAVPLLFGLT
ncbi:MAG: ABC transporter permease, partial [Bradyrhizobium sp.]|nr:ABC transporter permease [Bradyrhizobium sp.]